MHRPRVVPVLQIDGGRLVKSKQFSSFDYVGDPLNTIRLFGEYEIDELCLIDISARRLGRTIDFNLVEFGAKELSVPLTVGGGLCTLDQIQTLFELGVERVVLGHIANTDLSFLESAVKYFGSSSIAVCVDVVSNHTTDYAVFDYFTGAISRGETLKCWLKKRENIGVGEFIIQSVDRDGTRLGYDMNLCSYCLSVLSCSMMILGGARDSAELLAVSTNTAVPALGIGHMACFRYQAGAVLLSYPQLFQRHQ